MKFLGSFILLFITLIINSQVLFNQGIVHGGITAAGYSTGVGFDSGYFDIYIEPGSTIKSAHMFSYRVGYPPYPDFLLNNNAIVYDSSEMQTIFSYPSPYASPHAIFAKDLTSIINTTPTSHFNVTIPLQNDLPINWGFWSMFLVVVYENPTLPKTAYSIVLNEQNLIGNEYYLVNSINTIDTTSPVGFAIYSDRTGSYFKKNNELYINGNYIGIMGGEDQVNNFRDFAGVKGHFYYQNNTLYGLDDDTPDNIVDSTDGLADISGYIMNNSTSLNFRLKHVDYPNQPDNATSVNLVYLLSYTTPCDTFSTSLNVIDTTICATQPLHLEINGLPQYTYEWHILDSIVTTGNVLNVAPEHSQLYSVWVRDTNGCMVTEQVNIHVNDIPKIDSILVTPTLCGDSTGSIEVVGVTGGVPLFGVAYLYTLNGEDNTNISVYNNEFIHLESGEYIIRVTEDLGCYVEDTVQVNEVINVDANFSASSSSGEYPLSVELTNLSTNAESYYWYLLDDTLTTTNASAVFDTTGIYTVELIAWQNEERCADTTLKQINVQAPFKVTVPSVYNAHTGAFSVYAYGTKEVEFTVFNSIGQMVYQVSLNITDGENNIWYNPEISQGVYHYRMTATSIDGSKQSKSGKILVVK